MRRPEPTEITITGELPNETTQARSTPGSGSLGSMANPYPADFVFGNSSLAANATVGILRFRFGMRIINVDRQVE